MSNNLVFKNISLILDGTEQKILENNTNNRYVIISGFITNNSSLDKPYYGEDDIIEYLKIYDNISFDTNFLYNQQTIYKSTSFPIKRTFVEPNQKLYIKSTKQNILQISLSYLEVTDYETGFLRVIFNPEKLVSQNPKWNIVGVTNYYSHQEYVNLLNGDYQIEFSDVNGWVKPDPINVHIFKFKTTECFVKYDLQKASLLIKNEQVDIKNSFEWRIKDTNTWYQNNVEILLTSGDYIIEFKEIIGFITPENLKITLENEKIYNYNIRYDRIKSNITTFINPPFKRFGLSNKINNRWRIIFNDGGKSEWYISDQSIPFEIEQNYVLEIEENEYYIPEQNLLDFYLTSTDKEFHINMLEKT